MRAATWHPWNYRRHEAIYADQPRVKICYSTPMRSLAHPCARSRFRGTRFTPAMLPLLYEVGGSMSHRNCETNGSNNFWLRWSFLTAIGWGPSWPITAQMVSQVMTQSAFMVRTGSQQLVYSSFPESGGCEWPTPPLAARLLKTWFCSRIIHALIQASISLIAASAD